MINEDIELAKKSRLKAHAPISNFMVGAVLRTNEGKVYTGCNVENQGIQSFCAERTAFLKAISEGEKDFSSIVIVGALKDKNIEKECLPCGYCLQFMSEFVNDDFEIITFDGLNTKRYSINDLLPKRFDL